MAKLAGEAGPKLPHAGSSLRLSICNENQRSNQLPALASQLVIEQHSTVNGHLLPSKSCALSRWIRHNRSIHHPPLPTPLFFKAGPPSLAGGVSLARCCPVLMHGTHLPGQLQCPAAEGLVLSPCMPSFLEHAWCQGCWVATLQIDDGDETITRCRAGWRYTDSWCLILLHASLVCKLCVHSTTHGPWCDATPVFAPMSRP